MITYNVVKKMKENLKKLKESEANETNGRSSDKSLGTSALLYTKNKFGSDV